MLCMICGDQPEAILTGIYDAWADPVPNREIRIQLAGSGQTELFCQYRTVTASMEKAQKVARSIRAKLGADIWEDVETALMAAEADKGQAVFQYLRTAFAVGKQVKNDLGRPEVMRVFELNRMVRREYQHLQGFVRFADAPSGVLVAQLEPKHRQVPLLAPHFAERLNTERFILYDKGRKEAAVYAPEYGWYLTIGEAAGIDRLIRESEQDGYASLWQVFVSSIAIEERRNPRCQDNLLPKRFRPCMTEFRRFPH